MRIDHLLLLGLVVAAAHWLVARSVIMQWFWSRARGPLDALLRCPACSGFWLGLGAWGIGVRPAAAVPWWPVELIVTGLLGIILTPIFEGVLLWGLARSSMNAEESTE